MAFGDKQATKELIENLKSENARLREQVDKLQNALVAATSPRAYADMREEEEDAEEGEMRKNILTKWKSDMNAYSEYIAQIEKPSMFKNVDDMKEKLLELTGAPNPAGQSIHGNDES